MLLCSRVRQGNGQGIQLGQLPTDREVNEIRDLFLDAIYYDGKMSPSVRFVLFQVEARLNGGYRNCGWTGAARAGDTRRGTFLQVCACSGALRAHRLKTGWRNRGAADWATAFDQLSTACVQAIMAPAMRSLSPWEINVDHVSVRVVTKVA